MTIEVPFLNLSLPYLIALSSRMIGLIPRHTNCYKFGSEGPGTSLRADIRMRHLKLSCHYALLSREQVSVLSQKIFIYV